MLRNPKTPLKSHPSQIGFIWANLFLAQILKERLDVRAKSTALACSQIERGFIMMQRMFNLLGLFTLSGLLALPMKGYGSSIVTNPERICNEMQDETTEAKRCQKIVKETDFFENHAFNVCEGIVTADCTFCNTGGNDCLNVTRNKKFKKQKTEECQKLVDKGLYIDATECLK